LTKTETAYLQERIKFATETARAAVALEAGNESLAWAISKAARVTKWAFGKYGRKLTKERKAELTKMAAKAAA
jgi:hypothetical protein